MTATETVRFTGKERDAETGLDYFGARYFSGAQGRFTSPDAPLMDQHILNPQSWNLYSYVRNNPLRFVDPSGERIELIGEDEEARKRALAVIASGVSKEAASHLRIDAVKENGEMHYYVGVDNGLGNFSKMGDTASDLAKMIGAKPTVEFGVTDKALPGKGAGEAAYTYAPGEIGNQNVRVLVNPAEVNNASVTFSTNMIQRSKFASGMLRDLTTVGAAWHEFGHAWAMWMDMQARQSIIPGASGMGIGTGPGAIQRALDWENRMRQQLYGPIGPRNAKRIRH
jgi:RHS repeat-associated protein